MIIVDFSGRVLHSNHHQRALGLYLLIMQMHVKCGRIRCASPLAALQQFLDAAFCSISDLRSLAIPLLDQIGPLCSFIISPGLLHQVCKKKRSTTTIIIICVPVEALIKHLIEPCQAMNHTTTAVFRPKETFRYCSVVRLHLG